MREHLLVPHLLQYVFSLWSLTVFLVMEAVIESMAECEGACFLFWQILEHLRSHAT